MDNRFKVGDRVRVVKVSTSVPYYNIGDVFTITKVDSCPDTQMTYEGRKDGTNYSLWLMNEDIEYYKNKKTIVITSDGKETKARVIEGHKTIREATAKCNDKDTFCFETGAKIAFERLMNGNNYNSDMFRNAIDEAAEELNQKIHKCLMYVLGK